MASFSLPPPTNGLISPLLTDLYQLTMTYAHWKNNRHEDPAIFEMFFRKNPFGGEFTLFCGLDECLKFVDHFKFSESDIEYLKQIPSLNQCEEGFWEYLSSLDCSQVKIHSMKEGTIVFPRVPLLVIQAPLGIAQLLETTLLTLVNYPSLIATNAARMVIAARDSQSTSCPYKQCQKVPKCAEFGLRRAQGPDGGFSASKYSSVGGFAGTSNVLAGKLIGLNLVGTHAHSFVQAYATLSQVENIQLLDKKSGTTKNLLSAVLDYRTKMGSQYQTTNDGELASFIAYAGAFKDSFLCLVDTYDTLKSGILNFCLVSLVLDDFGYKPKGIRLDSGDLAYMSMECAKHFAQMEREFFQDLDIVASNDINEEVLIALAKQDHAITLFGIGTNLVTCQKQPALGCVYKLVEIMGKPRIKLSQEIEKVLIPGKKVPYRLYGVGGWPLLDVMLGASEPAPQAGTRILCRHPFIERKRVAVTAKKIVPLHHLVYDGKLVETSSSLQEAKEFVAQQLEAMRPDILRFTNPTPYKVSVSQELFTFLHDLWQAETPVAELS